jgi:MFS family permease
MMNFTALRSRNFRIFLAGNLFALNALWMLRVTVGWIGWETTGSASFVGLVAFVYFVPSLVAGPLFGVMTDRVNVRTAAIVTQVIMMSLAALLLLLRVTSLLGSAQLVFYATSAGVAMAAYGPIRMSLAPRLAAKQYVNSVINLTALNYNLVRLIGPALGGVLLGWAGVTPTLAVITIFYLPFLLALWKIKVRPRETGKEKTPAFYEALKDGMQRALGSAIIREALALTALSSFFLQGVLETLPVLADGIFSKGATGLGLLTSSAGFGALLGGALIALIRQEAGFRMPAYVYGVMLVGSVALMFLATTANWPIALGIIAVVACDGTVIGILSQSTIQSGIDDDFRGRVMSLWAMVAIGSNAIGAAVLGIIIEVGSMNLTLMTCSIASIIGVVWLGWYRNSRR